MADEPAVVIAQGTKITTTLGFLVVVVGTFVGLILSYESLKGKMEAALMESSKNQALLFVQQDQISKIIVNMALANQKFDDFQANYEYDMDSWIRERRTRNYPHLKGIYPGRPNPREAADAKK